MHKLIINIVLTVSISLFGFGWLIDQYISNALHDEHANIQPQSDMLNGFINHLADTSPQQLNTTIENLNQQFSVDLVLENREDFAFDGEMLEELDSIGLKVASDVEEYYLKSIPNHPGVLLKLTTVINIDDGRELDVVLTLILYFGVSVAVVLWMLPLIGRLTTLTNVANKFGEGDLSVRVTPARFSQINVLENSFNKMASQIEHLVEENRLLANSLSHDLRTPVSCFRFGLDACLYEQNVDKKNEYLVRMEKDVENIEGMLNAFLDYASMERKGMQLDFREINFHDFVSALIKDLRPIATQKNKRLDLFSNIPSAFVNIDSVWIYRAYTNLITNAISYAKTRVCVVFNTEFDARNNISFGVCYIYDDGPGIPDSELLKVFDAFVRLDSSRRREGKNFGLGLAIVKRVADWHNFKVSFLNNREIADCSLEFDIEQINSDEVGAVAKITMPLLS